MNKEYVLYNLREAAEELRRTIAEIEADSDYHDEELQAATAHAYHHLNTAWNARHASAAQVEACSRSDFARWRQFPSDIDLSSG